MGRNLFVLYSTLTPKEVANALRPSTDEQRWTPFSLSGYKGKLRSLHASSSASRDSGMARPTDDWRNILMAQAIR